MSPDLSLAPADASIQPLDAPAGPPVAVVRIETFVFRYPLETPVVTSFGRMADRPAVLVRIEDGDGATGWGEVWCNFPGVGAEHRARIIASEIAPRLVQAAAAPPEALTRRIEAGLRVLALQTGEWGPLAQCLAGIDIALWDLAARRAGLPLATLLRADAPQAVPLYASGIPAAAAEVEIPVQRAAGNSAFKVKVGFDRARDRAVLRALAAGLGPGERLMVDANQAWDVDAARAFAADTAALGLDWIEEPLAADRPLGDWRAVADAASAPLAAGENLRGSEAFARAIGSGAFGVIQPDACKWGGITGCLAVGRATRAAGLRYCPHFLGAGIGLVASAHLLAAVGGDGMLEVDCNPNPLRETLAAPFPALAAGHFPLPMAPGLGVTPDLATAARWRVA